MKLFIQYGPWAVITGAARGLGQALAEECAALGLNVILIDILDKELAQVASQISSTWPVAVKTICSNLANPSEVQQVIKECEPYPVGLFCCNHAATHLFPDNQLRFWLDTSTEDLQEILQVNLLSSLDLLFPFAQKMRSRGSGGIIFISSGACLAGAPYLGQYAATKAFLTNLGETLWWELKQNNVDVLTVITGLTKTPGMMRFINQKGIEKIPMMQPQEVSRIVLKHLGKGPIVIPGLQNKLQAFITRYLLPKKWTISLLGKMLAQFFHVRT